MSAIEKAAAMLLREAESMKECHTVGVGGEWYGDSAKADYDEMIAAADAAIAERDALRAKIDRMEKRLRLILEEPENTMSNSKAMREMLRQARLALEESK